MQIAPAATRLDQEKNGTNMKLIKPSEISAKILTLLDECNERIIIVSPYMKISKWYKLVKKINEVKSRRVRLEIFVRDDPDNSSTYRDLDHLALEYKRIPHLHSKCYLNEKSGIVTSMNLLISSEINSLEIGYETETWSDYNNLLSYYHRYILSGDPLPSGTIAGLPTTDSKEITGRIRAELNKASINSWLWLTENALLISTGRNKYNVSFKDHHLIINSFLKVTLTTGQRNLHCFSLIAKKIEDLTSMNVEMHPDAPYCPKPDQKQRSTPAFPSKLESLAGSTSDTVQEKIPGRHRVQNSGSKTFTLEIVGQAESILKSSLITGILSSEAQYVMDCVIRFISATEDLIVPKGFSDP